MCVCVSVEDRGQKKEKIMVTYIIFHTLRIMGSYLNVTWIFAATEEKINQKNYVSDIASIQPETKNRLKIKLIVCEHIGKYNQVTSRNSN